MVGVYYTLCDDYSAEKLDRALPEILLPVFNGYGGIEGKSVMIKPNLLEYRQENDPATVHPQLLWALCRFLKNAGACRIAIVENPAVRTADAVVRSMGIMPELEALGVTVSNCSDYEKFSDMPEACRNRQLELAAEFREYDLLIDFAKAKTHAMMTLTCGVKNLFGLVRGSERLSWHLAVGRNFDDFADMLLDIYLAVRPQITLLDAITGMEGNGPGSGDAVALGFLCASGDALALDASVAEKLGISDTPVLRRGRARNLLSGFCDHGDIPAVHRIKLPEEPRKILEWGVYFPVSLRKVLRKMLLSRPVVDKKKCISCGLCARKCPPQTLKMHRKLPKFDYAGCIRCYCCQEFCPQGAITVEQSSWLKMLSGVEKVIRKLNIRRMNGRKIISFLLISLIAAGAFFLGNFFTAVRQFDRHMSERKIHSEPAEPVVVEEVQPDPAAGLITQISAERDAAIVALNKAQADLLAAQEVAASAAEASRRAQAGAAEAQFNAETEAAVREFLHAVLTAIRPDGEEEQPVAFLEALRAELPEISRVSVWQHRREIALESASLLVSFEDYENALPLLQMAAALDQEHRPLSAKAMESSQSLGALYFSLGDCEAAMEQFEKYLTAGRELYGENHLSMAAGYHQIGSVYNALGRYSDALENFRRSLAVYEALQSAECAGIAVADYAIGITLAKLNQRREAIEFLQKAVDISGRVLGTDHPYTRQFERDLQRLRSAVE